MKVRFKYSFIILFTILSTIFNIDAHQYLVHTYNQENNMPNSMISSITQDSSGKIWAVTRRGLASYDGNKWQHNIVYNSRGQELTQIKYIKSDELNKLWVIQLNDSLRLFNYLEGYRNVKSVFITNDVYTQECRIHLNNTSNKLTVAVVIPNRGLYIFSNNKWKVYNKSNGIKDLEFLSVHTQGETVYFSNYTGLYKIENESLSSDLSTKYFKEKQLVLALANPRHSNNSTLWVLTSKSIGFIQHDKFNQVVQNLNIEYDDKLRFFTLIPNYFDNSIVWSNLLSIYSYNTKNKTIDTLQDYNGLIDNGCSDMFIDRENILWIASHRGISKISSMRFKNYYKRDGLLENEVSAIIEQSPGYYIFGQNNGITFYNHGKFEAVKFNRKNSYERVNYLAKDKNGNVWVSAYKNGLAKISKNRKLTWLTCESLGIDQVNALAVDSNNRVYCSNKSTIYEVINGKLKEIKINIPRIGEIRGIYCDKYNSLYITTGAGGLLKYANNKFTQYQSSNIKANNVFSVFVDDDGTILVGTEAGLFKTDYNGKLIRTGLNDKELNRYIFFITRDKNGNYWYGTEMGIIRRNQDHYWHYGTKEGLAGLETNRGAGIVDSKGRLIVGTNKGLSVYFSEFDVNRSVKPIVQLTTAEALNSSFQLSKPFLINEENVNLIINFNVVSFYDENKNKIYYKMEGSSESAINDWELLEEKHNYVRFKDLKPGNYIFKLRVVNALGVSSDIYSSQTIKIDKPLSIFYWLFILISMFISITLYFMLKNNRNKKFNSVLQREVSLRTAQLANSEQRYKQMFSENNAIMLIINPNNGDILDANPSAIQFFDLPKDQLVNKNIFSFKSSNPIDRNKALIDINTQKEIHIEYLVEKNNSLHHLKAHISTIKTEDESMLYCIVDDITEQVIAEKKLLTINEHLEEIVNNRTSELEEALETLHAEIVQRLEAESHLITAKNELENSLVREKELNQLKSRFIMMVSHEYRTPLTIIFSSAELIKEFVKMGHYDACIDYAKRIQESVKTLTELLEGVMAIGDETQVNVFKEDFNYNQFVDYIINDINNKTKGTHNIVIKPIDDNFIIKQDRNLLKQVFSQIISNSIKFSNKRKDIIFASSIVKDKLIITIKDFGCGIADKDIENIFEPFFKCKDDIGIVSGTGLGLAIVRKNILALGGKITAESELNIGTSIFIELPIK